MIIRPTVIHIICLRMAAVLATSIAGFAQVLPTPAAVPATIAAAATLPVQRTLTGADGRKLDVTILEKSATAIRARRTSDAKEFELELTKLSVEDQAFVAGLITPPAAPEKKPTVLLTWKDENVITRLEKAGFTVTIPRTEKRAEDGNGKPIKGSTTEYPVVENITDDEIKQFDIVWVTHMPSKKQFARFLGLVPTCKIVVWARAFKPTRSKFLAQEETKNNYDPPPLAYMHADGNLIFYNWQIKKWVSKTGTTPVVAEHPEIFDQVVAEAKRLTDLPVDLK